MYHKIQKKFKSTKPALYLQIVKVRPKLKNFEPNPSLIAYSCKSHFQTSRFETSEIWFYRTGFQTYEISIHVLRRFTFWFLRSWFKFRGWKSQPKDSRNLSFGGEVARILVSTYRMLFTVKSLVLYFWGMNFVSKIKDVIKIIL